ncbi:MAG: glutamate--cysteine ligase, partial [Candidatus Thermoplasmatota archaeon]|nr:glutamate--cysteine ligase [Candidatus Thermoplasmatota archaeon]
MTDGAWIDERIEANRERLTAWMAEKRSEVPIPIYGSVDVRDAGWKVAAVDANHFPAGFNNVPNEDRSRLAALLREHVERTNPGVTWIHLYPESHTRNPGYVENLRTLVDLLVRAGYWTTVGSPELNDLSQVRGLSGHLDLVNVQPDD